MKSLWYCSLWIKLALLVTLGLCISFCSATLDAEISVPDAINMCENSSYAIQINNSGEDPETDILLSVTIPDGYEYLNNNTKIYYLGNISEDDPDVDGREMLWNLTRIMEKDFNASESINVSFNLTTFCEVLGGGRIQFNLTWANGSSSISSDSIDLNFPIMKLEKLPTVIPAHRFDNVTYYVSVENTGTGPMYNVLVNDSPSAGLDLAYSTAGGLKWSYDKLEPGEKRTENISFIVNSCANLVNDVEATWGCNSTPCDIKQAKGSILFESRDPNLEYSISPDPIIVSYCGNQTVNVSLSNVGANVGDKVSYVMNLSLEFSGMPDDYIISNVTGATYSPSNSSFYAGNMVPGQRKYFTFDLGLPQGACSPSSGLISIFPHYNDACGRPWTPPTGLISYAMDSSNMPGLSVSKSGPEVLSVGETGTYNLSLNYSAGSCAQNITENVIVDYYPASFEVVQNGSGAVDTVNHTITWVDQTLEDGLPWSREIKLKAPESEPCNCGNTVSNTLSIEAMNDCCGCPLTGNSSVSTIIVCSSDTVFRSNKTATPSSQENCRNITYKTTYTFNQTGNITWNDLNFTERGGNNQTFPGGSQTGTATFVLNGSCSQNKSITLGDPINLSFLSDCHDLRGGDVLEIYVTLLQPSTGSFPEWSDLCINPVSSGCPTDPCFHDSVSVNVGRSDFSLGMNLANIMDSCGYYNFVINLNKNGPWNGSNMSISYNETNFKYIGPANISGINNSSGPVTDFEPVNSGPDLLTWYLGDLITSGGSIAFKVEKSCDQNREVSANLSYKDNCGTPLNDSFSGSPLILNKGSLYIDKTPELIYARGKNVLWRIYLSNKGSGTAYNTTMVDTLESGLIYTGSRINGISDPTNTTVSGQTITWNLGDLPPKKQKIIELNATISVCKNLNNHVMARWGCGESYPCQEIADDSTVIGLEPTVVVAKHDAGVVDDCGANTTFTIQADVFGANAYNLSISELLPAGLIFVPGSDIVTGANATSKNLAGNPLVWNFDSPEGYPPGSSINIKFNATAASPCSFASGRAVASINFTNPCGSYGITSKRNLGLRRADPRLSISKVPATSWFEKGSPVKWTITVRNIRRDTARNITLSDILPENTIYDAGNSSPPASSGIGTATSPLIWNLADMPRSSTRTIVVAAKVTNCTVEKRNDATVSWSCCLRQSAKSLAALRTLPEIALSKTSGPINTCGGDYTITISNSGTTAYSPSIHDKLPQGFIYRAGSANITSNNATHRSYLNTLPDEPLDYSGSNRSIIWNTSNIDRIYRGETITIKFSTESCSGCCDKVVLPNKDTAFFNYTDSCSNPYFKSFDLGVSPRLALLRVEKTPLSQTGAVARWKIAVSNIGNMTANNVTVTDIMEPGLSGPIVTPPSGTVYPNQPAPGYTTIVWSGLTIPVGSNVFVWNIQANANPAGGLVNNVSVEGVCPNGCIYSQDGDFAIASRINISKSDSPDESIGDYANFTIVVDYWGSGEKYNNSRIIDTLPPGLKYFNHDCSGCGSFSASGQNLTWDLGNFTGTRRVTINLSTIVENVLANQNGARLVNLVQSLHQNSEGIAFSANDTANVTIREPDLQIAKAANRTQAQAGDTIQYTLTATNAAPSSLPAYDVIISDHVPAEMTLQSYSSTPPANATTILGNSISWRYDQIPLGSSVQMSFNATLVGGFIVNDTVRNNATINWTSTKGSNPDERYGNWTALDDYNRAAHVDVRVDSATGLIKLPKEERNASIGLLSNYTLLLHLPRAIVRQLWVNDTIPRGLIYDNSTLQISGAASAVVLPVIINPPNDGTTTTLVSMYLGDVSNVAGQNVTIRFNATVADTPENREGGIIEENWATQSWKDINGIIRVSTDSSGILNLPAISVRKSAVLPPNYPNSNITFILNVTNIGKTVLDPIRIIDTLPLGMEHVSDNMSAMVSGRTVSAVIPGILYPGQSLYREIVARFDGSSYSGFENLVNASGTPPVGRDVWDLDQLPLPEITSGIRMVKTANNTSPQRNENVAYTITVTNTGNLTQETVRVVDYLPPEMELLSINPPGSIGGSTVIWENVGPLAAGESKNLTLVMRLR